MHMGLMRGAHEHEEKEVGRICAVLGALRKGRGGLMRGAHEHEKREAGGIALGGFARGLSFEKRGRFYSVSLLEACGLKLIIFKINR
jgi:hypothetical protein